MRKNLLILLLAIICNLSFAENFGADLFTADADAYFNSKDVNIYDLNIRELDELKEVLEEYRAFKGISIYEQIGNKEYSIVYEKSGLQKKFLILISLEDEIINLPDEGFETEEMNGLTIKYTIGEEQYIFAYDENQLIFSNDMTMFFLTIEQDLSQKQALSSKEKFSEMMNEDRPSAYKYYIETEDLVDDEYISLAKAYYELKSGGYIRKDYLLDGNEREYKIFDLTDYIPKEYEKVKMGLDSSIVKKAVSSTIPEFKLFDENKIDMYLKNNLEFSAEVETAKSGYTLVTLGDYQSSENFVKQIFEEALFYNKKINLVQETGYKYFEIPLLFRKVYFVEAGRFLILTEDFETVISYLSGEIYNENFVDVANYDEILVTEDKVSIKSNAENIMLEIENFTK